MILLDTHVWIWLLASPDKLSRIAADSIEGQNGDSQILISAMSVWELFMLVKKQRLSLTLPANAFLASTHGDSRFEVVPVDENIARHSVELADIHADPADRIILATAVRIGCPLVSGDARFQAYQVVPVIW